MAHNRTTSTRRSAPDGAYAQDADAQLRQAQGSTKTPASVYSLDEALEEYDCLSQCLIALANDLRKTTGVNVCAHTEAATREGVATYLTGLSLVFALGWRQINSREAYLEAALLSYLPSGAYRRVPHEPTQLKSWRFRYHRSHDHVQGWTAMDSSGEFFSTEDLASHLLEIYVDRWLEQHLPRGE